MDEAVSKILDKILGDENFFWYLAAIYLFARPQVDAVIKKYIGAPIKKKIVKTQHKKAVTKNDELLLKFKHRERVKESQIRMSRGHYERWSVIEYKREVMILDTATFHSAILEMIQICRERKEKITFSFINITSVNDGFIMAWEYAAMSILDENNVSVTLVFPQDGIDAIERLYASIEEYIISTGKGSVSLKRDRRT